MLLKLFTIRDIKAETSLAPFTARTTAEAIRMFSDDVQSGKSNLSRHPSDYVLMEIGTFDTSNNAIETGVTTMLGLGIDFVQESSEPALPNL